MIISSNERDSDTIPHECHVTMAEISLFLFLLRLCTKVMLPLNKHLRFGICPHLFGGFQLPSVRSNELHVGVELLCALCYVRAVPIFKPRN